MWARVRFGFSWIAWLRAASAASSSGAWPTSRSTSTGGRGFTAGPSSNEPQPTDTSANAPRRDT